MSHKILRPNAGDYPEYYKQYVDLIPDVDIIAYLDQQKKKVSDFFEDVTDSQLDYRYAEDKWSIREILKHIIDSEQVFAYRALCISRKEKVSLPGFDQDSYIANSNADDLSKSDLLTEFLLLRTFNIQMFRNFDDKMWIFKGVANNLDLQLRAIPYIIAGHLEHHLKIISSKYLNIR